MSVALVIGDMGDVGDPVPGAVAPAAGGSGEGAFCASAPHCGQAVAVSGMVAPHLKQNILDSSSGRV